MIKTDVRKREHVRDSGSRKRAYNRLFGRYSQISTQEDERLLAGTLKGKEAEKKKTSAWKLRGHNWKERPTGR